MNWVAVAMKEFLLEKVASQHSVMRLTLLQADEGAHEQNFPCQISKEFRVDGFALSLTQWQMKELTFVKYLAVDHS